MRTKTPLILILSALLLIFFSSCLDSEIINQPQKKSVKNNDCDFDHFEGDVLLTLAEDFEDLQYTKVNYILYHFGNVTRSLLENPDWKNLLSENLEDIKDPSVSIPEFCQLNPEIESFYNNGLATSISQKLAIANPFDWSVSDISKDQNNFVEILTEYLVYEGYSYFPTISLNVNADKFDGINSEYLVAIAEGINEHDEIVAYQNDCVVLVGEEDAKSYNGTILFIGISNDPYNNPDEIENKNDENFKFDEKEFKPFQEIDSNLKIQTGKMAAESWNQYLQKYQIKNGYNFERRGDSELAGGIGTIYFSGEVGNTYHWIGDARYNNIKVTRKDIKNSKIFNGSWHAENQLYRMSEGKCAQLNNLEENCNIPGLVMNMHERDWYANYKWYHPTCWSATNFTLTGFRAKFATEYYWRDCQTFFFSSLGGWFQYDGDTHEVSNYKCRFKWKRE